MTIHHKENKVKRVQVTLICLLISACTTQGKLAYIDAQGNQKYACETEYSWAPAVDKYAVEYILSHCAKKAEAKGYQVVDSSLLALNLQIPNSPNNQPWTFEYATELHDQEKLSDKEYGYIIAYIDLGLSQNSK